jgi:hypothetical protein
MTTPVLAKCEHKNGLDKDTANVACLLTNNEEHTFISHSPSTAEKIGGPSVPVHAPINLAETVKARKTHGAPPIAPIAVPILKRDTMRPSRTLENEQVATSPGVPHCANRRRKSFINKIPLICPVSRTTQWSLGHVYCPAWNQKQAPTLRTDYGSVCRKFLSPFFFWPG